MHLTWGEYFAKSRDNMTKYFLERLGIEISNQGSILTKSYILVTLMQLLTWWGGVFLTLLSLTGKIEKLPLRILVSILHSRAREANSIEAIKVHLFYLSLTGSVFYCFHT